MIIKQVNEYPNGYTAITEIDGKHADMLLNFGILKLRKEQIWKDSKHLERAWILIKGSVEFSWQGNREHGKRYSCFDENPIVLHVPADVPVKIKA